MAAFAVERLNERQSGVDSLHRVSSFRVRSRMMGLFCRSSVLEPFIRYGFNGALKTIAAREEERAGRMGQAQNPVLFEFDLVDTTRSWDDERTDRFSSLVVLTDEMIYVANPPADDARAYVERIEAGEPPSRVHEQHG